MAYRDFREYLTRLEEAGDLRRITSEVNWNEEVGAIILEGLKRRSPALLFENIKDYRVTHGRRLVGNFIESIHRGRIALDIPTTTPVPEIVQIMRQRFRSPVKPVVVFGGSCKEVVETEKDVNLLELPAPKIHHLDGGRYLMTWCNVITKDPESGWVNVGTYRGMVHDATSLGILCSATHHGSVHMRKWRSQGHRMMPMAVAMGVDPLSLICSGTSFPAGVNEFEMVGALRQAPVELTRCETIDLQVPAHAEIVLEGEITLDPSDFLPEGPFGEFTGHYVTLKDERRPVFHVRCVTHRQNPILTPKYVGPVSPTLVTEQNAFQGLASSAVTWNQLEDRGVEGLKGIRSAGPGGAITILSIKQSYYGHARQVASTLWGFSGGGKITIVVDDDVDISDLNKVMVAVANRVRPGEDVQVFRGFPGGGLDPSNHPDVLIRTDGTGNWDRLLIDATWPFDWQPRDEWGGLKHPPSCVTEGPINDAVQRRWKDLGID
jgi:4-hydroxy-3-polyprenylbenzoate decarboxylase